MKSLSLEKMEKIEGGGSCSLMADIFTGVALVAGIVAVFTPASAIILLAASASQGFAFGGVAAFLHFNRTCGRIS
ncbi:MAG: hypothetical protein ACI83B_003527 [Sediminicola sp.]|jgi:hypothetical protein